MLSNDHLSAVGFAHGLADCVILNQGTTSVSSKTMATTVEALLGAVYLDAGRNALVSVLTVLGLIHPFLQVVMFHIPHPDLESRDHTSPFTNEVLRPRRWGT